MLHNRTQSFKLNGTYGSIGSKKMSIDSHSHDDSNHDEPEDVRKNFKNCLYFDPKSVNEREGKIDIGKQ